MSFRASPTLEDLRRAARYCIWQSERLGLGPVRRRDTVRLRVVIGPAGRLVARRLVGRSEIDRQVHGHLAKQLMIVKKQLVVMMLTERLDKRCDVHMSYMRGFCGGRGVESSSP